VENLGRSGLFDDSAATSLTNGTKLPLFVAMNCLNGFFHDVYTQSLAESVDGWRQNGGCGVGVGKFRAHGSRPASSKWISNW